mgnify:FL=1
MQVELIKKLRNLTGSPIAHCKKALEECGGDFTQAQEWLRLKGVSQAHKKLAKRVGAGLVAGNLTPQAGYLLEVLCETDFVANTEIFQNFTQEVLYTWKDSRKDFSHIQDCLMPSFQMSVSDAKMHAISKTQENVHLSRAEKFEVDEQSAVGVYLHNLVREDLGKAGCMLKLSSETNIQAHRPRLEKLANDLCMQVIAAKPLFLERSQVPDEYIEKEKAAILEQLDDTTKQKPSQVLEKIVKGKLDKAIQQVCLLDQVFMISEEDTDDSVGKVLQRVSEDIDSPLKVQKFLSYACES